MYQVFARIWIAQARGLNRRMERRCTASLRTAYEILRSWDEDVTRPKKVKLNKANYFRFYLFPCSVPVWFWTRDCSSMGPRKDEPWCLGSCRGTRPSQGAHHLVCHLLWRGVDVSKVSWFHGRTPWLQLWYCRRYRRRTWYWRWPAFRGTRRSSPSAATMRYVLNKLLLLTFLIPRCSGQLGQDVGARVAPGQGRWTRECTPSPRAC